MHFENRIKWSEDHFYVKIRLCEHIYQMLIKHRTNRMDQMKFFRKQILRCKRRMNLISFILKMNFWLMLNIEFISKQCFRTICFIRNQKWILLNNVDRQSLIVVLWLKIYIWCADGVVYLLYTKLFLYYFSRIYILK